MSSTYRPNTNNTNPGPTTVLADNLPTSQLGSGLTSCDGCISLATTQNYRSDFDKTYIRLYQMAILDRVNTDLETTLFAK